MTVAFCYLSRLDLAQATVRIRSSIRHYNDCQGTANTDHSGYHETLTRFWIGVAVKFLREADSEQSELDGVSRLLETYEAESRRQWIEPDLKVL